MKEELANLVQTFQALGPLVGNAVKRGQLLKPRCELTEPNPDALCEYDVSVSSTTSALEAAVGICTWSVEPCVMMTARSITFLSSRTLLASRSPGALPCSPAG